MKKIIKETGEKANDRLHSMCDGLSPKIRLFLVIASLTVFAALAVYMAVSSVYRADKSGIEVEHIRQLKLNQPGMHTDSINVLKIKEYDDAE